MTHIRRARDKITQFSLLASSKFAAQFIVLCCLTHAATNRASYPLWLGLHP